MKRNIENMPDDLLVKYMLGEASAEEQSEINKWITTSPDNRKYFEHFQLIWNTSKEIEARSTVNEHEAWDRFQQKIAQESNKQTIVFKPARTRWLRAAAVLVVVLGVGLFFLVRNIGGGMTELRTADNIITDTLSDGSVVTLNKNSMLKYPEHFNGDTRVVSLEGEAFFHVAPDKAKPFYIKVNDVTVRVVGTSFNVKHTTDKTEVIVETGIVEVSKESNKVELNPHEKAVVPNDGKSPIKQKNTDELYNYYRTKELICNGTPLWRLVEVLNESYGAKIVIVNPAKRDLPLTATYPNESLDTIISLLKDTFPELSFEKANGQILIK